MDELTHDVTQRQDNATGTDPDGITRAPDLRDSDHVDRRQATRQLFALALPTFGQLIAEPTFVLIDTAIVGHIGDAALAGLSVGSTIILTTVGLCVFLAYGTTSSVAQLIGAGKRRKGLETGIDGLWLALAIGVLVSAALFAAARPLCWAMGARGAVLVNAVVYLRALVFGLPGMLLVYAANGIFRGLSKVNITFIAAVAGAAVNTALDVLFVFGLHWGVAGSGAATLVAQWFMGLFLVVPALLWARADGASWRPRLAGILGTASNGAPLFIRTLALRVSLVATVMLAARMGTQVLAAYQAVDSSWNFVLNMLDAIGIAGQTLVATQIGAGRRGNAHVMTSIAGKSGLFAGAVIGVGLAAAGLVATGLFSPSPDVQHLIMVGMLVQGVFLPLAGWMWALDGILIGAEDYRYLALTCTITALTYLASLVGVNALDDAAQPSASWRMAILWGVLNLVFIGLRAVFNGLRTRSSVWMADRPTSSASSGYGSAQPAQTQLS
ncbi:MATE family efflux transporter [Bifidobacterium sp.]|uniref:MATE family efflux transporter n=1 Tax=Bifidobacterium sp. TaxID=41200 RepID=UPI0025BE913F|nr:MATE family efflux transporter [Bifidobacterium sp.]MCH4209105.1 MATE family efflux transporter [Bifidobacterium sp.]MCI1224714.1 MATE family efflux transporter [Bifidobacterium sp.]